jgi:hypothetical protein
VVLHATSDLLELVLEALRERGWVAVARADVVIQ